LYSLPKAGINAVPTVKITLGTPFPGVPARNDPISVSFQRIAHVKQNSNNSTVGVLTGHFGP